MEPILLIGGALLLLTASKSQAGTVTDGNDPNNPAGFVPGQFVNNMNKSLLGATIQSHEEPIVPLEGIQSYANYAFVENALNALGYNVDEITDDAINACVYRVSVYFWYYQFQAIGKANPELAMVETGAFAVIDEWIQFQGYAKIAGIPWNRSTERNKLVSYNNKLKQGMYLAGLEDAAEIVQFAAENQEMISQFTDFLESIGIDPLGSQPGDLVLEWLTENNVDGSTAANIKGLINSGSKYWDAAVTFHIYLVNNPSVLPIYTPVYIQ